MARLLIETTRKRDDYKMFERIIEMLPIVVADINTEDSRNLIKACHEQQAWADGHIYVNVEVGKEVIEAMAHIEPNPLLYSPDNWIHDWALEQRGA